MHIKDVWRRLVAEGRRISDSRELGELCARAGLDPKNTVDYLRRTGHIDVVFRGVYYVRSPEEVELGYIGRTFEEVLSLAMERKGIRRWYFGLETALAYNGMTHQHFDVTWVVTDSHRTSRTVVIMGRRVRFLRWVERLLDFGIVDVGTLRYSDPAKTLLDLAYRQSYKGRDPAVVMDEYMESYTGYDKRRFRKYIRLYPLSVRRALRWQT